MAILASYLAIIGTIPLLILEMVNRLEMPVWFYGASGNIPSIILIMSLGGAYSWIAYRGAVEYGVTASKGEGPQEFCSNIGKMFVVYGILILVLPGASFYLYDPDNYIISEIGVFLFLLKLVFVIAFGLLVFLPGGLFMGLMAVFAVPIFTYAFVSMIPYFGIGIYSFSAGGSESSAVAEKHTQTKRPSKDIEKQLADAMVSGEESDSELRKIIGELGPTERFFHLMTYKKKAQKYREVRDLMNAQAEAMREEEAMAESAHQYERTKRKYDR